MENFPDNKLRVEIVNQGQISISFTDEIVVKLSYTQNYIRCKQIKPKGETNIMKKVLLLTIVILALSLAACGGKSVNEGDNQSAPDGSDVVQTNTDSKASDDVKELLTGWAGNYIDYETQNSLQIFDDGQIALNGLVSEIKRIEGEESPKFYFDYQDAEYSFFTAEKGVSIACNYSYGDRWCAFDLEVNGNNNMSGDSGMGSQPWASTAEYINAACNTAEGDKIKHMTGNVIEEVVVAILV